MTAPGRLVRTNARFTYIFLRPWISIGDHIQLTFFFNLSGTSGPERTTGFLSPYLLKHMKLGMKKGTVVVAL